MKGYIYRPAGNNWKKLSEVDFTDKSILQYHVDTRDFHCLCKTTVSEKIPNIAKLSKYGNRFFHTDQEVSDMINRYHIESGGEMDWRFFIIDAKDCDNWSLKYLRIYRTPFGLVVCNSDGRAINRDALQCAIKKDLYS